MPRAITPNASGAGGGEGAAWLIPAAAAVALVAAGAVEAAGAVASAVTGHGARWAPFTTTGLTTLIRHGTGAYWPGVQPRVIWIGAAAATVLLLAAPAVWLARRALRTPAADDPARSMARLAQLRPFLTSQTTTRAQRLRPSLTGLPAKEIPAPEIGVQLGRFGKWPLFASWEDVALAIMAPRSGKSTALAIPATLAAPGAVLITSNKPDVLAATGALRAARTGQPVWVFDPQHLAHTAQTWWWNPLAGLHTVEEAERLASHFVVTVEDERSRDIWGPAASELLATLLLAAAVSDRSLLDVYAWLSNESAPEPVGILTDAGFGLLARALRGTQDSPPETRGSVYFTARAATKCLRNGEITAWVTPPTTLQKMAEFDPVGFPTSRQTLYLLSKDGGGSAAPLVAAFADRVLRAGVIAAEKRGGRLDPPLLLVLDEAANVCRIADLPDLYSHLGSRGILPVTILQSYSQGVGVWGENKMAALWGAATVKLIGAGMDDADFAEDVSRLIGDHDVTTISRSTGGKSGASRSASTRQQRILPAAAIRALPKGQALFLATGTTPALITLTPWYSGPDAAAITAATRTANTKTLATVTTGPVTTGPVPATTAAGAAAETVTAGWAPEAAS
jgi:type IV secretory pathway TraG/TraD family ATPase VirD4